MDSAIKSATKNDMNKAGGRCYDIAREAIPNETEVAMGNAIYETVYEFFEKQVTEHARKKLSLLAAETPFDNVGMDSLEKLSVAMDLEEHFDLFIPDADVEIFTNIQEVVNYLELAIAKKSAEPVVEEPVVEEPVVEAPVAEELSDKGQIDEVGGTGQEK